MAGLFAAPSRPSAPAGGLFAYHPTIRDKIATAIIGDSGPYGMRSKIANLLVGSEGLGSTGALNLADMSGLGLLMTSQESGRDIASGHPIRGAANLAMALPIPLAKVAGPAVRALEGAGVKAADQGAAKLMQHAAATAAPPPPIVAYHGSPHSFDRFSTDKLGTGEGAQAYGHGLYFAENESTAQAYRKALAGPRADFDGKISPELKAELAKVDFLGFDSAGEATAAMRQHADWPQRWDVPDPTAIQRAFDAHEARKFGGQGHMYQVGVNADPQHFLDWDAPLSQQHPSVQEALAQRGITDPEYTGGQAYESSKLVPGDYRNPKAASQALQEAGIPGIKYLDQGSRTAGAGTRNYVVFNDQLVDILKRYGIAAPAVMGAGAAAYGSQQDPRPQGLFGAAQ